MESKTLEKLSKALIAVGLGYLTYVVTTLPKDMQEDVQKLADDGAVEGIKQLVDSEAKFLPQEEQKDC